MESKYKGFVEWAPSEDELALFYQNEETSIPEMLENEYLLIKDKNNQIIDKRVLKKGLLEQVRYSVISSSQCGHIKPRNVYQELAINMLQDRTTPVKIFQGTYGCGKDYLMSAQAMGLIEKNKFEKLIYIRPNVSLGAVPEVGYLKGGLDEKLGWTMAPLWDKFGGREAIDMLQETGQLEMVPLPFIRGRSFENSIVYVSEGQNITREVAAVILSRLGEGSELWINGDCHSQTDKRVYDRNNGITAMIDTLKGNELFQLVYSPVTERSKVAQLAATLMGD